MMSKVIKPDNTEVTFKYDSLGRRIEKCSDDKTISFVWDGNTILHEYFSEEDSDEFENQVEYSSENKLGMPDNLITWVFNDEFVPSAKITSEGNYSIISDYLGTPVEAYDEQGKQVWSAELDIYGRMVEFTGEQDFIPFRYQGQYEDSEIGLYYNRFRYYSPSEGMYLQKDPIGLAGEQMNLYCYVGDPNTLIDPMGLSQTYWLEKAMRAAGRAPGRGQTAHHIVPLNSNTKYGKLSRDLLERNGLNPDIAENGARLWGTSRTQRSLPVHPGRDAARKMGNYHAGKHIHSPANDKQIYRILRKAEKKGLDIKNILSDIGERMEDGRWKNTIKCH